MKNLFIAAVALFLVLSLMNKLAHKRHAEAGQPSSQGSIPTSGHDSVLSPLYAKPYVVVYGRTTCGWTQQCLRDLDGEGVPVIYKEIDNQKARDELFPRMQKAGKSIDSFNLPVVDVNGRIYIRPPSKLVTVLYSHSQ